MGGIDPLIRRLPPLPSFFSPPSLYPLSRSFTLPCFPTRSNRLFFLPHLSPLNLSFTQCSPSLSIPFNFILLTPFPTYSSSISPTLFPSSFPSLSCHFLILSCINPCPFPSTCICISPPASRFPMPSPPSLPYPLSPDLSLSPPPSFTLHYPLHTFLILPHPLSLPISPTYSSPPLSVLPSLLPHPFSLLPYPFHHPFLSPSLLSPSLSPPLPSPFPITCPFPPLPLHR